MVAVEPATRGATKLEWAHLWRRELSRSSALEPSFNELQLIVFSGEDGITKTRRQSPLMACRSRRPELPLDSIVGIVNWELDSNICDEVIEKFKEECSHG